MSSAADSPRAAFVDVPRPRAIDRLAEAGRDVAGGVAAVGLVAWSVLAVLRFFTHDDGATRLPQAALRAFLAAGDVFGACVVVACAVWLLLDLRVAHTARPQSTGDQGVPTR